MTGWGSRTRLLLAGSLCAAVAAAPVASRAEGGTEHRTLFRFADRAITESSGLVDAGSVVYTMNDSGSGPVLYAVDPATGRTAGATTYTDDAVVDVEALAPDPGGDVWIGDLGDNLRRRRSVALYRVEPGRDRAARRYDLTYPDGPRDAEALLVHPRSGRVFVVSKTVFGGTVYEARRLDSARSNRLRPFAQVAGLVTDGAFFPDGLHVLLRGYGGATVYTFPGFDPVGTVTLPTQKQGEGVAVGEDGRILLSSEGLHAPVLELSLPAGLAAVVEGRRGGATASVAPSASVRASGTGSPREDPSRDSGSRSEATESTEGAGPDPLWIAVGVAGLVVLAGLVRAARRR